MGDTINKLYGRPPQYAPAPSDLLTFKMVSESRLTWVTSVPILFFLGLSVLEFDPMYAIDRQTSDVRQKHRLMPPPYGDGSIIKSNKICIFIAMFRGGGIVEPQRRG